MITRPVKINIEPNHNLSVPFMVRVDAIWIDRLGQKKMMVSIVSENISMDQLLLIVENIVKESQK